MKAATFDAKGERVVTASFDNTALIWDAPPPDPGWSAAPAGWWARMEARPNPSRRLRSGGGWNVRRRGRIGSDGLGGRLLDVPDFTN